MKLRSEQGNGSAKLLGEDGKVLAVLANMKDAQYLENRVNISDELLAAMKAIIDWQTKSGDPTLSDLMPAIKSAYVFLNSDCKGLKKLMAIAAPGGAKLLDSSGNTFAQMADYSEARFFAVCANGHESRVESIRSVYLWADRIGSPTFNLLMPILSLVLEKDRILTSKKSSMRNGA